MIRSMRAYVMTAAELYNSKLFSEYRFEDSDKEPVGLFKVVEQPPGGCMPCAKIVLANYCGERQWGEDEMDLTTEVLLLADRDKLRMFYINTRGDECRPILTPFKKKVFGGGNSECLHDVLGL